MRLSTAPNASRWCVALIGAALVAALSEPTGHAAPPTWKSRIAAATRYAEARRGVVTFAVQDEAGRLHGYHARRAAPSASVLKAMLLVAYLRRPDVRARPLARWERDLLAPMIRRSDNAAAARMIGLVGEARLDRLASAAGMEHFRFHWPVWGESEITPRGQALFFRQIDRLVPERHRRYALHLLASVIPPQRWGVGRVAQGRWHLFFKGGWGSGTGWVDHQVALYAAAGERLSLALFTRFNPDHAYGKETLRGLAARLLRGIARPGAAVPRAAGGEVEPHYLIVSRPGCRALAIRPVGGPTRSYATGASSCRGFRLVAAGRRALWTWPVGAAAYLRTAAFGDATATDLGTFDSSDPLGPLAGGGGTLAYLHGDNLTTFEEGDCPASGSVLAAGRRWVAFATGADIEVLDPVTCHVEHSLTAAGTVRALALGGDILLSLARTPAGRLRIERFRLSTGAALGGIGAPRGTEPDLAVRGGWASYRTPHALRVLDLESGRAWTVWRPERAPIAAGLAGRRLVWIEDCRSRARLWSLRLPRDQAS